MGGKVPDTCTSNKMIYETKSSMKRTKRTNSPWKDVSRGIISHCAIAYSSNGSYRTASPTLRRRTSTPASKCTGSEGGRRSRRLPCNKKNSARYYIYHIYIITFILFIYIYLKLPNQGDGFSFSTKINIGEKFQSEAIVGSPDAFVCLATPEFFS